MQKNTQIAACGEYRLKLQELFTSRQGEGGQGLPGIVMNPRCIFNLVQSNFLLATKTNDLPTYYRLKTQILRMVCFLMEDFPLNAKFLYQQPWMIIEGNRRINLVSYLAREVRDTLKWQGAEGELKETSQEYLRACSDVFYQICGCCTLRTSELKEITNSLADFYYQGQLSTRKVGTCFRLLDAGLQQRNITPYLYFVGSNRSDSVRVLFSNNRWHFGKGMTVFFWVSLLRRTSTRLFWMATDDGSHLELSLEGDSLIVDTKKGGNLKHIAEHRQKEIVAGFSLPLNTPTMVAIELQPTDSFFKGGGFRLNIRMGSGQWLDIGVGKIPNFDKSEFIVEFSILGHFIGKLFGVVVTARAEMAKWDQVRGISQCGICRQSLVWQFLGKEILRRESILCIFNPERSFQGFLLNYVSERNHACFQGRVSAVKYHKYDCKVIDIYLPFLHCLSNNLSYKALVNDKDAAWSELFDLLLQHLLQIVGRENYETDSVMFILYFLQVNDYRLSQSTLNCLYHTLTQQPNFYVILHLIQLSIVAKYLDVHALIQKGLKVQSQVQPFDDPVQKAILMFHLETLWKEKWNVFQGFEGWWSPHFFSAQNDLPFRPQDFVYSPTRESRIEWSVLNLVTKDSCKCMVEPVFLTPAYAVTNRFQQQYMRRQCYTEPFRLNLNPTPTTTSSKLVCVKAAASPLDRLKSRLLATQDLFSPLKREEVKEFRSECLFIDILAVVEGEIAINRHGFLIFTSSHAARGFDHMCIKAFKNQSFYYLSMAFGDIRKVYRKRFNATNNAVYVKTKDGREMMFHFYRKNADAFLALLAPYVKVKLDPLSTYLSAQQPLQWIDKAISNYEYLQWLNEIAGRNYNDITQYPVLPWVFVASQEGQEKAYRDLDKNMGNHGDKERVDRFREKYQQNNEQELFNEYHYGTHYSSSAIIFNYLIRIRPYSIGALTLQSGRFDCADRIFYSYYGSWVNATSSPTDIRELIPQLYTLPEMFINKNNYEYGLTQEKVAVDNVILPQWAQGNPFRFVARLRRELQSAYVCQHLQHWIDLVYGYKQRGKQAVQNLNIFYPLTYQNCIDLDKVEDPEERISFETQIAHFGQNPSQVIGNNPHPSRRTKAPWQGKLIADGGELTIQKCFLNKAPLKQQKFLFRSVFEGRNSILAVRFVTEDLFFVLRKHEYHLFKILNRKGDFLSREQTVPYELQSCSVSLNYKQLSTFVPVSVLNEQVVIIGGFYDGNVQVLFLKENKFNRPFKFPTNTITAINYERAYQCLFVGDEEGYLKTYRVGIHQKQIQFQPLRTIKAHDSKINELSLNYKANLLCSCSEDGNLNLYNLYSQAIIRTIHHPQRLPLHSAHISTTPLYCIAFYSKQNSTVYVYSINGQYLQSIQQKSGHLYNLSILKSTDSTECLVYLNAQREMFIWQLPFLQLKRKVKVKRDEFRVSCFETCHNGKIGISGTEDGALQIIANPAAY